MSRKLNKNLVALGSAAILTVYGIGFARTSLTSTGSGPDTASLATPTPVAVARAIAAATPAPSQASAPAQSSAPSRSTTTSAATTAAFQNGTFTGSGTSRHGGFDVAVTIAGSRITAVNLTRVTTRYPASRISRLPGQVVDRQSAGVDIVSGATDSSRAFRDAVAQALAKATAQTAAGQGQG